MRHPQPRLTMRSISRSVKVVIEDSMKGSSTNSATDMMMILGAKVRVCSCSWVMAWNSEIVMPTTSDSSIIGPATCSITRIASRAISSVSASVIPKSPETKPAMPSSDRHPHDVLVGGDHLVAHRYHGLQRHFRIGDRGHHVGQLDIGAGGGLDAQRLGAFGGGQRVLGGVLDHLAEALPGFRRGRRTVRQRGARGGLVGGGGIGWVNRHLYLLALPRVLWLNPG